MNKQPDQKSTLASQNPFMLAAVITVITFLCFTPVLKNGFTNWDDNGYVFENTANLGKPVGEAMSYFFGQHYFIGNYIPVTMIVYALEYHAAGLKPHFFHLLNLLIHLVNVLLVFWLIYRLSGKKPLVAAFVALFFGIHPMHVESVAWISELKDVLYSAFFLAGLICYCRYGEGKYQSRKWLVIAFVLFFLSVLSKPAAVIFPIVLLLIDLYNKRQSTRQLWLEKLPFLAISIIFGLIAIKAQQADRFLHEDHALWQQLLFASYSLLVYLAKCLLPVHLSIFYPYPQATGGHLPVIFYLAPLIVIALLYLVYRTLKQSRLVVFGVLFFLVNLLLVLQLVSVGEAILAERYTYLAYIGLFFIVAMVLDRWYAGRYKVVVASTCIVAAIACAYQTQARCKVWLNDDSIADDLLMKFPDDRLALNNKGYILFEKGKTAEAIPLFTKALRIKPDYTMASINLCNAYLTLKDYNNALGTIDAALKQAPADHNLLNKKGYLLFAQHQYPEAAEFYKRSLKAKPDNINAYLNLAECYFVMKDYKQGLETINTALNYAPNNYLLLNNKGYMLYLTGSYPEAAQYFEASLQIKPSYQTAAKNLENCRKAMAAGGNMEHR